MSKKKRTRYQGSYMENGYLIQYTYEHDDRGRMVNEKVVSKTKR
jgi:hypothetical protein